MIVNDEVGVKARKACCEPMHLATVAFLAAMEEQLESSIFFCSMTATDAGGSDEACEKWLEFFKELRPLLLILVEVLTGRAAIEGDRVQLTDLCRDIIGDDATPETAIQKLSATDGWCGVHAT
jgi:hypothetical protein